MEQQEDKQTLSVLAQEAIFLYDLGIPVFLADTRTRRGISRTSEYDPITDKDHLVYLCEQNPAANLEIAVNKDSGLVALGVGVGQWDYNGEKSFAGMCDRYGLPETLSYKLPTGEVYYLFKPGDEGSFKPQHESGVQLITTPEGIPAYPSLVDNHQVTRQGIPKVQNLDDWLAGKSVTSEPTMEEDGGDSGPGIATFTAPEPQPTEPATTSEVEPMEESATADTGDEKDPVIAVNPTSDLAAEITGWITSGSDKTTVLSNALKWNLSNRVPHQTEDIVALVEELTQSAAEEVPPLTPRDLLFKLADAMILFNDDQTKPYFFYEGEAFAAPSIHVKNRLSHHYLNEMKDLPPPKELSAVLSILESRARFDGERISLFNRVAKTNEAFVYDLRDKRYVQLTSTGWYIVDSFPLFRRYQHLQPQAEPITGGDPWKVFDFLTVPEESRLLIMVYIISLFVPKIAHPILAVYGDQGSSKSFFCTVINRLVDPTLTERVIQPKNERDLIQTLRQKYVTVLDNLSKIDNRVSDIFCQVCTGGSISYRQLYTDEGENIAQFRHVVILNSINLAIVNADLMDRSIILKLHRIDPANRKPEHELWEAFEAARPGILGSIFDTVSRAMAIYPEVTARNWPRLADFAKWGYAIAEALGRSGDQFLDDFSQNVKRQNESVVEKNVLCQAVLTLMAEGKPFLAKVGDAHETLKSIAKQDAKDETFPKLPHLMRAALDRLRASLLEHGVSYEYLDRQGAGVRILFTRTDSPGSSPALAVATPTGASEPYEADEPLGVIPVVELEEIPEVVGE